MRVFLLCLPLLALTACSDEPPKKADAEPNYGVYQQQMKSLDTAKGVEQQLQQDVKDRDQKLRDMGG